MQFNLKLSQKGFILVAVPLVFEIIFVIAIAALLEQAETERKLEAHSKEIVSASNDLSKTLFDCASSIVGWNFTHNEMFYTRHTESLSRLRSGLSNLKQLTAEDKGKKKRAINIARHGDKVLDFLTAYSGKAKDGDITMDFTLFRRQLSAAYQPFIEELHQLADQEKERASRAPIAEIERKRKLTTLLTVGIAINVLIAISLSVFFKGITRRLRVLMSNAKLLARKEPLHNPLRGTDEIAELDGVFHEMAEALVSAEQRKAEFVSTICHDLRSPLANVQVSLALAAKGKYGDLNARGVERFGKAEQSIDRLINLLNELLDAEKMEAGLMELDLEEMQLASAIHVSVDAVRVLAESANVQLEVAPDSDAKVIGDQTRLIRVLVNLLSNAVKFSPPGTTVRVSVVHGDTTCDVRISDQGKGIAPDDQKKIFDRFHRLSDREGPSGIGLGLTICKNVIEAHGGEIGVESTVGKGSTFWFRLKLA